jgi:hypothetical protein
MTGIEILELVMGLAPLAFLPFSLRWSLISTACLLVVAICSMILSLAGFNVYG